MYDLLKIDSFCMIPTWVLHSLDSVEADSLQGSMQYWSKNTYHFITAEKKQLSEVLNMAAQGGCHIDDCWLLRKPKSVF